MKTSKMIIQVVEKSDNRILYATKDFGLNDGWVQKCYFIPTNSTFPYHKLTEGMHYLIMSSNIEGVWFWYEAYPINIHSKIEDY